MDGPTVRVYCMFAHLHSIESGRSNIISQNCLFKVRNFFGPGPGPTGCGYWIPAVNDP